jgi:hypothetical protein
MAIGSRRRCADALSQSLQFCCGPRDAHCSADRPHSAPHLRVSYSLCHHCRRPLSSRNAQRSDEYSISSASLRRAAYGR